MLLHFSLEPFLIDTDWLKLLVEICKNTALLEKFFSHVEKLVWTFHFNLNEAIVWNVGKIVALCSLFKLNERREESVLEDIDLREYFSLFLLIYNMGTYDKWFRITS